MKLLHVRIAAAHEAPLSALTQRNGLYPIYAGRSAAYTVNELLRTHPDLKAANAQIASEQHPKPTAAKKR